MFNFISQDLVPFISHTLLIKNKIVPIFSIIQLQVKCKFGSKKSELNKALMYSRRDIWVAKKINIAILDMDWLVEL
jgi:hypothetical protein